MARTCAVGSPRPSGSVAKPAFTRTLWKDARSVAPSCRSQAASCRQPPNVPLPCCFFHRDSCWHTAFCSPVTWRIMFGNERPHQSCSSNTSLTHPPIASAMLEAARPRLVRRRFCALPSSAPREDMCLSQIQRNAPQGEESYPQQ